MITKEQVENNKLLPGEKYFQEVRTATFRKEEYSYIHTGIIDEEGETWTTTEMDEANIFQVYNQYRLRHGIPFPDEISALREHYGLSAAKMAQILGLESTNIGCMRREKFRVSPTQGRLLQLEKKMFSWHLSRPLKLI